MLQQHMVQITPPITASTYTLDTKCHFYDKLERSGHAAAALLHHKSNDIHCGFCDGSYL